MTREEIIEHLKLNDSSVLSFKDRGSTWGDAKYRGNCSGWVIAYLLWKFKVKKLAELFSGSGTGSDVARDMRIQYCGGDLNPVPVRPDIMCVNAITDEVPVGFLDADFWFFHSPYGAEIGIPYAGSMYPDPTGELSKYDLGQMPWDKFIKEYSKIIAKYFYAMEPGARMGLLMGDVRRHHYRSMLRDIVIPGELESIIIKQQYNTQSGRRTYSSNNFVPIAHEYIAVFKKAAPYIINFQMPQNYSIDIRDSKSATWRDIVFSVLQKIGNTDLENIYSEIENHEKCKNNPHWKEKVRQTLQINDVFISKVRGKWGLAA